MAKNTEWKQAFDKDGKEVMVLVEQVEVPDPEPSPPTLEERIEALEAEVKSLKQVQPKEL